MLVVHIRLEALGFEFSFYSSTLGTGCVGVWLHAGLALGEVGSRMGSIRGCMGCGGVRLMAGFVWLILKDNFYFCVFFLIFKIKIFY